VIEELLRALGQIGDPGAVPAIEKRAVGGMFKKPPTDVRVAAYRALALIGTPHAKQLIEDAGNDKDPEVRTVARSLVGKS
jgi:HEAT repeat protein